MGGRVQYMKIIIFIDNKHYVFWHFELTQLSDFHKSLQIL